MFNVQLQSRALRTPRGCHEATITGGSRPLVGPAVELTVEIDNHYLPLHCNLTSVRRPTRQSLAPASVFLCRGWTGQSEGSNGVQAEGRTRLIDGYVSVQLCSFIVLGSLHSCGNACSVVVRDE